MTIRSYTSLTNYPLAGHRVQMIQNTISISRFAPIPFVDKTSAFMFITPMVNVMGRKRKQVVLSPKP